ncbi:MAG: hypothetical protein H6719_12755 [Sandaracinaceae bacterium]|nr:hypothetical protein [Sandaracinaceae bacterium]
MRARWLTLALITAPLAGCFDMHGLGDSDAGPPEADAGALMCELYPGAVMELSCPSVVVAGTSAVVRVQTSPTTCCDSGTVRRQVETVGRRHLVELEWDACDCCPTCRCVGPIEEVEITLENLFDLGAHTVEAGGATCTFEVLAPTPSTCGPAPGGGGFRAPEHVLEGQPYPATLTSEPGFGCDCRPRVVGAESLSYALELCDCCDECDCIDGGYQAGHVHDPLPVGTHMVGFPHGAGQVEVHPRDECAEIPAVSLEVEGPRLDLVQGGQRLWWVRATGEALVCCVTPEPVVEQLATADDGSIALRMLSCHREDCDCVGRPVPTSAWFSLGELPSGRQLVRLGDLVATFEVP